MRRLAEQPGGAGIDRERALVIGDRQLEQAGAANDAGVADQRIETAESFFSGCDNLRRDFGIGEIAGKNLRLHALAAQFGCHFLKLFLVQVDKQHLRGLAFARGRIATQLKRDSATDTAGSTCDNGFHSKRPPRYYWDDLTRKMHRRAVFVVAAILKCMHHEATITIESPAER